MAVNPFGAKFQLSATAIVGAAGEFAELTNVPLPKVSKATEDITNHSSPNKITQRMSTLKTMEPMEIGFNTTPGSTTDSLCMTAAMSDAEYFFKMTVAGQTYSGKCIVTDYDPGDAGVDNILEGTLSIDPQGAITQAAAA